jgi:hypothetical protein
MPLYKVEYWVTADKYIIETVEAEDYDSVEAVIDENADWLSGDLTVSQVEICRIEEIND